MSSGGSESDVSLTDFFQAEVKRAGHILGLDGEVGFKPSDAMETVKVDSAGNQSKVSLNFLLEGLSDFAPPPDEEDVWYEIRHAFGTARYNIDNTLLNEDLRAAATLNKIKKIPPVLSVNDSTGWHSHEIGIAFYGEYMIVANRGEGRRENMVEGDTQDCTKIYKIDPSKITHEQLEALHTNQADPKFMLNAIKAITGDNPPVATFPTKPQKYGTCTYVNRVALTEGMRCLVKLQKEGNLNDNAIKEFASKPENRKVYKSFTKHCRDKEIDRIITAMDKAQSNPEKLAMYVNLALEIVKQRTKRMEKEEDPQKILVERQRNEKLMIAVSKHYAAVEPNITTENKKFKSLPLPPLTDRFADSLIKDLRVRIESQRNSQPSQDVNGRDALLNNLERMFKHLESKGLPPEKKDVELIRVLQQWMLVVNMDRKNSKEAKDEAIVIVDEAYQHFREKLNASSTAASPNQVETKSLDISISTKDLTDGLKKWGAKDEMKLPEGTKALPTETLPKPTVGTNPLDIPKFFNTKDLAGEFKKLGDTTDELKSTKVTKALVFSKLNPLDLKDFIAKPSSDDAYKPLNKLK